MHGVVEDSYRKTSRLINRVRHQSEEEGTPWRTLCDGSESEGTHILAHVEARTEQILAHHDFTSEGHPAEERETASASTALSSAAIQAAVAACECSEEEKEEMGDNPVPYEEPSTQTYVTLDEVGVKRQEAHRCPAPAPDPEAKKEKKKKKYVYTPLAHIEHDGASYVCVGSKVVRVLRMVLALLLHNRLGTQGLIFLTDGQKTLQAAILCAFSWWGSLQLILDWYHLEKRCKEVLSLALKGREIRNTTLEKLRPFALAWIDRSGHPVSPSVGRGADQERRGPRRIDRLSGALPTLHPLLCGAPEIGLAQFQQYR